MYRLSKREKILIFIMLFLLVIVGMAGALLMPALNRRLEYQEAIAAGQMEKAVMEAAFQRRGELENQVADRREKVKEAAAVFYGPMSTEETGRTLVTMMDLHGLTARSMTVTAPAPKNLALTVEEDAVYTYSYLQSLKKAGEFAKDAGGEASGTESGGKESAEAENAGNESAGAENAGNESAGNESAGEKAPEAESSGAKAKKSGLGSAEALCSTVSGEAAGAEGAIRAFLTTVSENPSMEMKEFSISQEETGSFVLDYSVEVYMMEQLTD